MLEKIFQNCLIRKGKFYYHKIEKKRVFGVCPVLTLGNIPDLDKLKNDPNLPEELKKMFELLESSKELINNDNSEYRTFEYVKLETQILAENLKYHE